MTAHPLTLAAERRVLARSDRYLIEFRYMPERWSSDPPGDWWTPNEPLPTTIIDVMHMIAENHPLEAPNAPVGSYTHGGEGLMRVTLLCADTGQFRDVTEDMAAAFGRWTVERGNDWPLWAEDEGCE